MKGIWFLALCMLFIALCVKADFLCGFMRKLALLAWSAPILMHCKEEASVAQFDLPGSSK
ncbi:hypothetical protein H8L32_20950 [Undibacterium sp. CY18W]|uniref:Uncharacterized protein n=1 Tax=Undibacterium hunanense TaxID=2762292 RepID=A0ABR6ZVP6_9BURK|nr:hypothetical protein [Undibacterium hunanense]MBC3919952.1 hypothetical protein [Undibacterium hunanense]